ncbi:hypothetical protein F8S13_08810 [Chloroflexia bacterium SDU3-3]|nr:hypothetical protein F8S13_08810 [Chloroflexia bacterium SDU3-3]
MKSTLQILLRVVIILAAAAVVSFGGQTLIHSTFGQSLTGMPSGGQGGPPAGEQGEGQGSAQPSADAATTSAGQGQQRGGRGGERGGNAIMELFKNLAIVLVLTAIGGLITTVAQRILRRRGKPALSGASD